jgi:hypothetical protein
MGASRRRETSLGNRGRRSAAQNEMAAFSIRTMASVIGSAAVVAFAITAYSAPATGRTSGATDPTALSLFAKASVGGRAGCEVQSWPYVAPECLASADGRATAKVARRI